MRIAKTLTARVGRPASGAFVDEAGTVNHLHLHACRDGPTRKACCAAEIKTVLLDAYEISERVFNFLPGLVAVHVGRLRNEIVTRLTSGVDGERIRVFKSTSVSWTNGHMKTKFSTSTSRRLPARKKSAGGSNFGHVLGAYLGSGLPAEEFVRRVRDKSLVIGLGQDGPGNVASSRRSRAG